MYVPQPPGRAHPLQLARHAVQRGCDFLAVQVILEREHKKGEEENSQKTGFFLGSRKENWTSRKFTLLPYNYDTDTEDSHLYSVK